MECRTLSFETLYDYARRNGYIGTLEAYIRGVYNAYCDMCERCAVEPMTFDGWCLNRSSDT